MSYSSIYFQYRTSMIHWWEYDENNEKVHHTRRAPLYFYMKDKKGDFTSIYGDKLKKKYYDTIGQYNDARKMYKDAGKKLFESDVNVVNKFILENWADKDIMVPEFDVHFLDIEVHSEEGFPKPEDADQPVTIITVWSTKRNKFYIFAEKDFDSDFLKDLETGEMKHWIKTFNTEEELLKTFIKFIRKMHPDILSGWNSNFYDIPYIVNRCNKLLGERATSKMSPINMIKKRTVKIRNKNGQIFEKEKFEIAGINCIDYLELYKNYTQNERETYALDFIAKTEKCGEKLKYDGTLKELYQNDWQKYVEYNVQDVQLLINLNNRLQFMDMMIGICYNCRIPFEQFAITTKVLDGAFMSRLMRDKIALPDVTGSKKSSQYIGAYVCDPDVGVHDWVLSFDATSLYPSIMMEHNISPETKYGKVDEHEARIIMDILEGKDVDAGNRSLETETGETCDELAKYIKENKLSIASNGAIYRHDKQGIVPRFVEEWFNKRKYHKNKMIEAEKSDNEEEHKLQYGLQLNYKILINSVYGYLGTEWSRLYDPDNATAVTTVGQECLKSTIDVIDNYFSTWEKTKIGKRLKAVSVDRTVCYGDTDSVYLAAGRILKSIKYNTSDIKKTVSFLEDKLIPLITKIIQNKMEHVALKRMNVPENKIFFKREMIARRSIHLAKKRYVAWVLDMEGVPIEEGSDDELEVKGIEIVRSTTPEIVQKYLKSVILKLIKCLDYQEVFDVIKEIHTEFMNADPSSIAKNSSINNILKYTEDGLPTKGAPQQVKGAILYNNMIDTLHLEDKYEKIQEGDKGKIVYIIPQDHFNNNCITFKDKIPPEFGLENAVDYGIMWQKLFLKPLDQFYKLLRWEIPNCEIEDIEDLFT